MKFKKLIILLVIVSIFTVACTKEIESESVEIESSQRETDVALDDLKEGEEDTVDEDVEMVEPYVAKSPMEIPEIIKKISDK